MTTAHSQPPSAVERRLNLQITGMRCVNCSKSIERGLESLPVVKAARVVLATERAGIALSDEAPGDALDQVLAKVRSLGYQAEPVRPGVRRAKSGRGEWAWFLFALALTAPMMAAMLWWRLRGQEHPPWHGPVFGVVTTIVVFGPGATFFRGAFHALKNRQGTMDVLVALGIGTAWLWSVAEFRNPDLHCRQFFFDAAAMLVTFIRLGKLLETKAKGRASRALEALLDLRPSQARRVAPDGFVREIPADLVKPGDVLELRAGDGVSADGVVLAGHALIDEQALTGESLPVERGPGTMVTSGTVVRSGYARMCAERVGEDTRVAHMARLVEAAQARPAPIQRFADQVAAFFVPTVVALGVLTFAWWLLVEGKQPAQALKFAVAVIVVACPCALGLATPTAIVVGSGIGLKRGLLVKNGAVLEILARVRTVIFDKTGTLTTGKPRLRSVRCARGVDEHELLRVALPLADKSSHPFSQALVAARTATDDAGFTDVREIPGSGVEARSDAGAVLLGKPSWAASTLDSDAERAALDELLAGAPPDASPVACVSGGRALGVFFFADEPRPDAAATVAELRDLGLASALLTGDAEAPAQAVAEAVGIRVWRARRTPEEKLAYIEEARRAVGPVAMVGDGVNDAPALAAADAGIALGGGTDIAREAGDMVLMNGRLSDLPMAVRLARATLAKIRQNLAWALVYNVVMLPFAAGIFAAWHVVLDPAAAGAAMAMSSVSVVVNALLLERARLQGTGASSGKPAGERRPPLTEGSPSSAHG